MNRNSLFGLLWALILAGVLGGMLHAAFRPFERSPSNDAVFDVANGSLRFGSEGGSGIAELARPLSPSSTETPELTVALWLRTADAPGNRGEAILSIDDGASPAVLRIGQKASFVRLDWREVRKGRRRTRLLGRGDVFRPGTEHFVAVVTGESGTRISVDGHLYDDLTSNSPALASGFAERAETRFVLGNDATGRIGWRGDLIGYLITQRALNVTELGRLEKRFRAGQSVANFDTSGAVVSAIHFAANRALPPRLELPVTLANLRRPVLQRDRKPPKFDAVQNLFGFMPLGFLLVLAPGGWRRPTWARVGLAALGCCALSLCIELVQVQFPARFSSLYDWGLNTVGGTAGALLGFWLARLKIPTNVSSASDH